MDADGQGRTLDDRSLVDLHHAWREQGRVAEGDDVRRGLEWVAAASRSQSDDKALVRKAKQGDEGAFEDLRKKHWKRTCALCKKLLGIYVTGNVNLEPEDAALVTFVKLWRALPGLPEDVNVPAFLSVTAHNVCIDEIRKRHVRAELDGESLDEVRFSPEGDPMPKLEYSGLLPSTPSAEQEEMWRETRAAVNRLMARLPERQQAVLTLSVQGLTHKEVATVLNTSEINVRSNLRHAREKMETLLVDEGILQPKASGGNAR